MNRRALHLDCRLEALDPAIRELSAHVAMALPPGAATRLEIAVTEALNNIVLHGGLAHTSGIDVFARPATGGVEIEIRDPGSPVPPAVFSDIADLDQIDPLAESGRGLPLIKAMSDALAFHVEDGTNRLTLRFTPRTGE